MPATSQQQQKLMGIVRALQKGDVKPSSVSKKAQQMAKSMDPKDVKDFAATKHKGLPKKAKKEEAMGTPSMYVVRKAMEGLTAETMVLELNPLEGIQPLNIMQDDVHTVTTDETEAQRIAAEAYDKYCNEAMALEEKKGKVGDKIKKTIDQLEKKRKEHVDMAKEDPKNAAKHKEHIAKLATQIDDLMSKMEKIEKSKKEIEKKEDKKKDLKEAFEVPGSGAGKIVADNSLLSIRFPISQMPDNIPARVADVLNFLKSLPGNKYTDGYRDGEEVGHIDLSIPYTTNLSDEDFKKELENSKTLNNATR